MRLAALFSGGKDSTYALYKSMKEHEIKYLVTMFPQREDSWMFHHPCVELTKLQAESIGIKQIIGTTKGEKEKELEDLKRVLEKIKDEIDGVVSGAVASNYQKSRVDKICKELGLKSVAPLWNKNPEQLLREEVENFEIMITSVSTGGLDKSWIGRKLDAEAVEELKGLQERYKFNLVFEGGEAETFACDGPIFKKKIKILDSEIVWDDKTGSGYLIVKKAVLNSKKV